MQHRQVLSLVLEQMSDSSEWDVRKEAVWVVSNVATAAKVQHLLALLEMNALKPIVQTLEVQDDKIIMCALEALEVLLKLDSNRSDLGLLNSIADFGGVQALETLQEHANEDIYQKSVELIETYFGGEEEDLVENVAPKSVNNQFTFGITDGSFGNGASAHNVSPSKQSVFNLGPLRDQHRLSLECSRSLKRLGINCIELQLYFMLSFWQIFGRIRN